VIVRTIGFLVFLYSTAGLFWGVIRILGIQTNQPLHFTIAGEFIAAAYYFVIGIAVMCCTGWISRLTYKLSN
jgi:hypothetical protein